MPSSKSGAGAPPPAAAEMERRISLWILAAILIVSALYLLQFLRWKPIWGDESLTYFTLSHRTLAGLWHFQATTPIVLEPPTHDLLLWGVSRLFGSSQLALRAPAALAFVVLQALLFWLATHIAGYRAGVVAAAALPATHFVSYGAECRPYAWLTALTFAALLLWHGLSRQSRHRRGYLAALALVVALATTSQFFGAMILLPVLVAELFLAFQERRRPAGDLLLIVVGTALLALLVDLPFFRAVHAYKPTASAVPLTQAQFALSYTWGFFEQPLWLKQHQVGPHGYVFGALLLGLLGGFPWRRSSLAGADPQPMRLALWAALAALLLYPLPAMLAGHFYTHAYHPRYAIQCVPALVVLLACLLGRVLRPVPWLLLPIIGLALVLVIAKHAHDLLEDQKSFHSVVQKQYSPGPAVNALLAAHAGQPVYLTIDECLLYPFFGSPEFASRIRCLASEAQEMRFNGSRMSSLTAEVMATRTALPYPLATYRAFHTAGEVILVYQHKDWLTWIPESLQADQAHIRYIGQGLGGDVFTVQFPRSAAPARRAELQGFPGLNPVRH